MHATGCDCNNLGIRKNETKIFWEGLMLLGKCAGLNNMCYDAGSKCTIIQLFGVLLADCLFNVTDKRRM